METKEHFFSESIQNVKDYCNDRMLLLKLQSVEKASKTIAIIVTAILLGFLGCFVLLFISISAAFFFASQTGSTAIGFAIVAGIYLLLFLIMLIGGKKLLQKVIINSVIRNCFKDTKKDNEQQETNNKPE